jgi:hypothetical protein
MKLGTRDSRKTGTGILPRCCGRRLSRLFAWRRAVRRDHAPTGRAACGGRTPRAALRLPWADGCRPFRPGKKPRQQQRRTRATPLRRRLRRAGMPAIHEGGTPSLRAATAKITAETAVLRTTTAKNAGNSASPKATQSRDARGTRGRDALATRDNGEDHGRDGRATHDKRKTGTGILPRFWFLRQAPVTAFRVKKPNVPMSRTPRHCIRAA